MRAESPIERAWLAEPLELAAQLRACTALVSKLLSQRLGDAFAITLPRFDVLIQLHGAPAGLSITEISARVMVCPSNTTRVVHRLEQDGLVFRARCDSDRRTSVIRLTPEGATRAALMVRRYNACLEKIFASVAREDIEKIMQLLAGTKVSISGVAAKASA
jgi:DNA-binding MarR family transcriptional regulator